MLILSRALDHEKALKAMGLDSSVTQEDCTQGLVGLSSPLAYIGHTPNSEFWGTSCIHFWGVGATFLRLMIAP